MANMNAATTMEPAAKKRIALTPTLNALLANDYFQEFSAGTISALAISPAMTIIDKAIIRAQFHKMSLMQAKTSLMYELFTGKTNWNPALGIMIKVYGATYLTANMTGAFCRDIGVDASTPTSVLTTLVNCAMIAWKDKEYAKLYNTKNMDNFPKISYGLFFLRDGLTIISSFNLKHQFRRYLQAEYDMPHVQAELAASFATPMFAQLFSTPLHIMAMDIFDNPNATWAQRMAAIKKGYMSVCTGRILRIIPAFGAAGYINDTVNEKLSGHELY
jgi:hypothetical protein